MIDAENVFLFEEHSSTLPVWWTRQDRARPVVYLDAHLDLQQTDPRSLTALESCISVDEVRALEAPDHFNLSPRYAFGIENFLYPASRLGLIERLIWVAPPHIPRSYSPALIEYMQQMDGISFEELTSFRPQGRNALRGRLLGLDITICDYDELSNLDIGADYLLDIDIDYFVEVPADRLWVDPGSVAQTIVAQLGEPRLVTISRAVGSGFTPLAFRYVGDYLRSYFAGSENDLAYYRGLTGAVQDLADGRLDAGRCRCEALFESRPDLAAAPYLLALATAEPARKKEWLEISESRNSAYGFDLAREAIGLLHRKKPPQPQQIRTLHASLQNVRDNGDHQRASLALAQVMAAAGQLDIARSLLESLRGDYADHGDIALALAARLMQQPERRDAVRALLRQASEGEKNATIANFYLGELALAESKRDDAIEFFQRAHERAPAWQLPLERLLDCYRSAKRPKKIGEIETAIELRRSKLDRILAAEP